METHDTDRSTLFTARSTENAMTFFTVVGFLTLAAILIYHRFYEDDKWYATLVGVWERIPHVFSFSTLLTIFKEGVDVMLTRFKEYRDRRKQMIAEEVAKEVAKVIEKAREEAYEEGYEAAKAEARSQENKSG